MYDYRKNEKDNSNTGSSQLKNLSFISAVSIAGISYLNRANIAISSVEKANADLIARERTKIESYEPVFVGRENTILDTVPDTVSDKFATEIIKPRTLLDQVIWDEDDDLFGSDDLFVPAESRSEKDPIMRFFMEEDERKSATLSEDVIKESRRSAAKLEKAYRGLTAMIEGNGIAIDYVKETMKYDQRTFDIVLRNIKTGVTEKVSLPKYDLGVIKQGNLNWVFRPGALKVTDTRLIMERFDTSFIKTFQPMLKRLGNITEGDKVTHMKKYLQNTLANMFQKDGVILNSNEIIGITGNMFIRGESTEHLNKLYRAANRNEMLRGNISYEGLDVYLLTPDGEQIPTNTTSSVTGVSETSFTKSAAGMTRPRLSMGPLPDYYKQSTYRQNVMKGWGVNRSRDEWSIKFGAVASDILDKISSTEVEDYT